MTHDSQCELDETFVTCRCDLRAEETQRQRLANLARGFYTGSNS